MRTGDQQGSAVAVRLDTGPYSCANVLGKRSAMQPRLVPFCTPNGPLGERVGLHLAGHVAEGGQDEA